MWVHIVSYYVQNTKYPTTPMMVTVSERDFKSLSSELLIRSPVDVSFQLGSPLPVLYRRTQKFSIPFPSIHIDNNTEDPHFTIGFDVNVLLPPLSTI